MVFYVYLDPPVFEAAAAGGQMALQLLTAILRGFLQNCVLLEFDDYRWDTAVRRAVNSQEKTFDRSAIKKLLVQLQRRNRIVPFFKDDYSGLPDLEFVVQQASAAGLDLILSVQTVSLPSNCSCEAAILGTYQESEFEDQRAETAANGREYKHGEMGEEQFLLTTFQKFIRHARRIEVCDAVCGRYFGDNFKYTLKKFLAFLDSALVDPAVCELILHCEKSERDQYLLSELTSFRTARLAQMPISVCFYDPINGQQCLPHERYICTDQFGLQIGRGMDFLDRATARNRDISVSFKPWNVLSTKLTPYQCFKLAPVQIP
ncbi:MAG: hypothetical protein C5B50_28155 [Verrucomicrobia bacterium]|nr:MAG: hypothetical protein C5B50_28155 [Verrucomicrobiota bacterium]